MEQIGMRDHVKLPVIAILQIRHTMIPSKNIAENKVEIIIFFDMVFSPAFSKPFTSVFSCLLHFSEIYFSRNNEILQHISAGALACMGQRGDRGAKTIYRKLSGGQFDLVDDIVP